MLKKRVPDRPDQQLESTLIALVYTLIALTISLLLLFIYPQQSLMLIMAILIITVLSIGLTIRVLGSSEDAIAFGGLVSEIMQSRDIIKRIDNADGAPIIENLPAQNFFQTDGKVIDFLEKNLSEETDITDFDRLKTALKNLREEEITLSLNLGGREWYKVTLRPISLKKAALFEEEYSIEKIKRETYFLWTVENITAARNMGQIFENERQRLHNFIQYLPIGIFTARADGALEYVNETFARQLGFNREDLIGKNLVSFSVDSMLTTPFEGLSFFRTADKTNAQFFVVQNNFKENDEIKIRGLTLRHIPLDSEILESRNYVTDEIDWLFNTAPTGILFVNKLGQIERANAKSAEILDTPLNELTNKKLKDFFQAKALGLLEEVYNQYAKYEKNRDMNKLETRLKAGKIVRVITAPRRRWHSAQKSYDGLVLYLTDVTEQKNLEMRAVQGEKMQAMGQMAGGVAHDFNNLLTAMIGFCDLLLQRHGVGDPSFADLIQIKQNANRAASLVRQLLAFSRQQPLNPKRIDVTENFIELSHLLKRILGEQIKLEFYHGRDLGYIRVDPVQFSQVILNLAVNAKDAMEGKGTLSISTDTETLRERYQFGADTIPPGDFVVIRVTDTGCGIPPENLSHIFEPFFSTKQNIVGSGTGLGLAMVYGIVRQTGGFIKVESVLNKGTTFAIHLPRFDTLDEDDVILEQPPKEQKAPLLTAGAGNAKPILGLNVSKIDNVMEPIGNPQDIKILFVEDEDSVRVFGVRALKKKGYEVTGCASGEAALELLDEGKTFNLLITDMVMPGISGAELAICVKDKIKDIRIILASGYSEEIAKKELAGSQDFEFIAKPYSLGDLNKKVLAVLNKGQAK